MYKVIHNTTISKLELDVQSYLDAGWTLIGGISSIVRPDGSIEFFQSIYTNEFV